MCICNGILYVFVDVLVVSEAFCVLFTSLILIIMYHPVTCGVSYYHTHTLYRTLYRVIYPTL